VASAALAGQGSVVQSIDSGEVNGGIDCLVDSTNDSPHGAKPARAWTSLAQGA
jgi:hypothetical protein